MEYSHSSGALALLAALYTLIVVAVGIWKSRDSGSSSSDYYLAGRGIKSWAAAFSGAASAESGWVLLGLVGSAYSVGVSAFWVVPGSVAGYLFAWLVLGPRLRGLSERSDAVTIPEALAERHPEKRRPILMVGALIILAFLTVYVAAQFNAVGKTLDSLFGVPYLVGVLIGLVLVLAYVLFGGFAASVWTDFVQALMMIFVLILLPILLFMMFPGEVGQVFTQGPMKEAHVFDTAWLDPLHGAVGMAALGGVLGWMGIGLGYMGQPHMLARFMAIQDDRELKRAAWIATIWTGLLLTGAVCLGLICRGLLPQLADAEQAITEAAMLFLPLPLTALVLAAILAAICSTADSQLLVVSSAISNDLMEVPKMDGARASRITLLVMGLLAGGLAATENRVIFDFVLYAFAALGCSFGPALLGSFLFRRTSGTGILAGLIGGVLTVIIWSNIPVLDNAVYEMVPAFFVGLLLTIFVAPHAANSPLIQEP